MTSDDSSETYRNMARDALRRAERAVSPNVRSRCLLMANQWNRRACELERAESCDSGESPNTDYSSGKTQRPPPPRA
jgi:hypothetical protein